MEAQMIEQSPASEVARPQPAPRARRVLVAEDDPDMRHLVAALLRQEGYSVVEACDGAEVIDRLESTIWGVRPDFFGAIVADVNMPGLGGFDVLAALACTNWETPVILITAYGDADARAEAEALGAFTILDKPLDPELLHAALRRAMATSRPLLGP